MVKIEKHRNIMYVIDQESQTITAKLYGCKEEFKNYIIKQLNKHQVYDMKILESEAVQKILNGVSDNYIAKTKCHPEDIWNEDLGKDLAKYSANVKKEKAFLSSLQKIINIENRSYQAICDAFNHRRGIANIEFNNLSLVSTCEEPIKIIQGKKTDNYLKIDGKLASPHICTDCGISSLNNLDDVQFKVKESTWFKLKNQDGSYSELCGSCANKRLRG